MSKETTTRQPLAMIADEAIEQISYDKEHATWLAALMSAIGTQLAHGRGMPQARIERAQALASLGQYLAEDLANYTDCRIGDLQKQLCAAEDLDRTLEAREVGHE